MSWHQSPVRVGRGVLRDLQRSDQHLVLSVAIKMWYEDFCARPALLGGADIADDAIQSDRVTNSVAVKVPYLDAGFLGFH